MLDNPGKVCVVFKPSFLPVQTKFFVININRIAVNQLACRFHIPVVPAKLSINSITGCAHSSLTFASATRSVYHFQTRTDCGGGKAVELMKTLTKSWHLII